MNNINDQKLEEILEKTLEYLNKGKSPGEILNLFPEYEIMLKEIFSTINLLKKEKESIAPSQELFKQVIEQIPGGVTNEADTRYKYQKEVQGRPSLNNTITKVHDLMTINWKMWAPLGIVAVVALVIIGSYQFGTQTPQAPVTGETPQAPVARETPQAPVAGQTPQAPIGGTAPAPVATKPATGNVDDAVNAILAGISDDQALFADGEKDIALVAADSQAISDFGQSYNENEF